MNDFTVLWEGEDGECYYYDFKAPSMNCAKITVIELQALAKRIAPDHPHCDMWDACIEIQDHGECE